MLFRSIEALERAGCGRARQYYNDWVAEYKTMRDAELLDSVVRELNRRKLITTDKSGAIKIKKPTEIPILMKGGMIDLEHVEKIDFIINNMLSPGLSMLAADPKIGKSWFALLMCLCVAQGRKFLGYDYKEMNKLKSFAKKHNLAMLLIHHTSKMDNPNDPFFLYIRYKRAYGGVGLNDGNEERK